MAKKKALPTKTCEDCVHEYACKCWTTGRALSPENASKCSAFETVKDTAGYLIGKMDGQKAAQPKWISVEERLPEIGRTVICCAKGYIPLIGTGWYDANLNMWHLDFVNNRPVTHWMPLPAPPKEKR